MIHEPSSFGITMYLPHLSGSELNKTDSLTLKPGQRVSSLETAVCQCFGSYQITRPAWYR